MWTPKNLTEHSLFNSVNSIKCYLDLLCLVILVLSIQNHQLHFSYNYLESIQFDKNRNTV